MLCHAAKNVAKNVKFVNVMLCHAAKNVKFLEPGHFKVLVAKTNGSKGCFSAFKNQSLTRKNENCHCRFFPFIYFARNNVLMKK